MIQQNSMLKIHSLWNLVFKGPPSSSIALTFSFLSTLHLFWWATPVSLFFFFFFLLLSHMSGSPGVALPQPTPSSGLDLFFTYLAANSTAIYSYTELLVQLLRQCPPVWVTCWQAWLLRGAVALLNLSAAESDCLLWPHLSLWGVCYWKAPSPQIQLPRRKHTP